MPESENDADAGRVLRVGVIGLGDMGGGLATSLIARRHAGVGVRCPRGGHRPVPGGGPCGGDAVGARRAAATWSSWSCSTTHRCGPSCRGPTACSPARRPGTTAVIVSTIPTDTVLEMRAEGAARGVTVVDCGVSGGPDASAAGELVCMIGGSEEEVDAVRPVLDAVSCLVLHMGPPGAGLAAKLARNLITYGSWLAAFEAQELAEAAGIDLLKLGEAARESDKRIGGATRLMFRTTAAPWPAGSDEGLLDAHARRRGGHPQGPGHHSGSWARTLGVDLPLAALAERRCGRIYGFEGDI